MQTFLFVVLSLVAGAIIGYRSGWNDAHVTVAKECDRLGAFYVGKIVYRCSRIDRDGDSGNGGE